MYQLIEDLTPIVEKHPLFTTAVAALVAIPTMVLMFQVMP